LLVEFILGKSILLREIARERKKSSPPPFIRTKSGNELNPFHISQDIFMR